MSREFQRIYNDSTIAAIKSGIVDMRSVFNIDFAEINALAQSLSQSATFPAEPEGEDTLPNDKLRMYGWERTSTEVRRVCDDLPCEKFFLLPFRCSDL